MKTFTVYWATDILVKSGHETLQADSFDSAAAIIKDRIAQQFNIRASLVRITSISREKVAS